MFGNIIPAAAFTAATTAPATLPVLSLLAVAGRHPMAICGTLTALVVLLVGWSFRRDHRQHRAIVAARSRWELTGQPQPGWAPGWAWSGFRADPEDDVEDQAGEDEVPAAVCASCQQPATVTVAVAGGPTFHLCTGCSPVATVLGRTA